MLKIKHLATSILLIHGAIAVTAGNVVDYVNPLIGTQSTFDLSNGNTYPAIARPWGMNFWMPQTGKMGDGWAYTYNDSKIKGFKQTHQPSPWINDYGQFSIMPVTGDRITEESRASWFSHKAETAKPHYYKVYLSDYDITAELTPTTRAAILRFTYPETDSAAIVIDAFDKGSYVRVIPEENKVIGYTTRNSGGVPDNFRNYFVIKFSKAPLSMSVWDNGDIQQGLEIKTDHAGAIVRFATRRGEQINAVAASSFISHEQAELNLNEANGQNFDKVMESGKKEWNDMLGRIEIDADETQKQMFYSCLYRSLLFPRVLHEVDADGNIMHYSPYDGSVRPGYMYTDTGFWDTFRSLFPLLNLVYPSVNRQIQAGLLNAYNESGFLPEWASPGHRDCMVGNNSASVVSDAILSGVVPREMWSDLYEAMTRTANSNHSECSSTGRLGYEYYNRLGYIPCDAGIRESAARTLEYAYDDWCIWQVARLLDRPADEQELYHDRSMNYRNLFNPEYNLMSGRNKDGTFPASFNPFKWGDAFTEGNSWHYSWSVFHDINGLIDLMGGRERFVSMLDSVFVMPPVFDDSYYGFVIHEIREMQVINMGNYAHGNQPIQHMIYLYGYAGEPWKSQYRVREVMDRLYKPTPDGYCGDEDNGQTSAWYVFSALGFYPVCPGSGQYVIGSPLVKKATIQLENGNRIEISAPDNSYTSPYVKTLRVNGKKYTRNYLDHAELKKGTKLIFDMYSTPCLSRGTKPEDSPYSMSRQEPVR